MAASAAIKGFGVTLTYLSAPSTQTPIGELKGFTPPNPTKETIDITHMASPDGYREFLSTLKDGGEAAAVFNYTPAGYAVLNTLFESDDKYVFTATLSNGDEFVYTAILTEKPVDNIEIDNAVMMSANFKVSGKPTFTAG